MPFITLRNNRNILIRNSKKNLWIFPIVKNDNNSPSRKYLYAKIYIHNNVWKICGDHFLIKFFFWCIIDIKKKFQKEATKTCFSECWQATECIFKLFLRTLLMFVCKKSKMFHPRGTLVPMLWGIVLHLVVILFSFNICNLSDTLQHIFKGKWMGENLIQCAT